MSLTEDTIELRVERHTDHVDRLFLTGAIDQTTYDKCIREINERAEAQYAAIARCK